MEQYRPALILPFGVARRATGVAIFGFAGVLGVGTTVWGAALLLQDARAGLHGRSPLRTPELDLLGLGGLVPTWALGVVAVVVGVVAVREASRLIPIYLGRRGFVDVAETPAGLVLRRLRWPGSARMLTVRRGSDLQVAARRLPLSSHTYRFEFTSADGRLVFDEGIYIDKLSMVPLDDAAGRAGITVTVTGDAVWLGRAGPTPG